MSIIELTQDDVAYRREELHAWLRTHDLDPKTTAVGLTVDGDELTAVIYLLDDEGHIYAVDDPEREFHKVPATRTVTMPVRVPLPTTLGTVRA